MKKLLKIVLSALMVLSVSMTVVAEEDEGIDTQAVGGDVNVGIKYNIPGETSQSVGTYQSNSTFTWTAEKFDGYEFVNWTVSSYDKNGIFSQVSISDPTNETLTLTIPNTAGVYCIANYKVIDDLSYTVKYLDQDGNELKSPKTVTGIAYGTKVTEQAPEITGYKVKDQEKGLTITEDSEIVFTYNVRTDYSYTIMGYETNSGKVIYTKKVDNVTYNSEVEVKAPEIEGYTVNGESSKKVTIDADDLRIPFGFDYTQYEVNEEGEIESISNIAEAVNKVKEVAETNGITVNYDDDITFEVKKSDVSEEKLPALKETLARNGYNTENAVYLDFELEVTVGNNKPFIVNSVGKAEITVNYNVPQELMNVPSNYTRTFYIVLFNNDGSISETWQWDFDQVKNNSIYFVTNHFSPKVLTYKDTKNPTSDSGSTDTGSVTRTEANTPCEEWHGSKNWTWSAKANACVYSVTNTSSK